MIGEGILALIADTMDLYGEKCRPICEEFEIPQSALDVLLFLANNPAMQTAKDIVKYRGMKKNLVSVNVERLVKAGYLKRESVVGDRRQKKLVCTELAEPILDAGRKAQEDFKNHLLKGLTEEEIALLKKLRGVIHRNVEEEMNR